MNGIGRGKAVDQAPQIVKFGANLGSTRWRAAAETVNALCQAHQFLAQILGQVAVLRQFAKGGQFASQRVHFVRDAAGNVLLQFAAQVLQGLGDILEIRFARKGCASRRLGIVFPVEDGLRSRAPRLGHPRCHRLLHPAIRQACVERRAAEVAFTRALQHALALANLVQRVEIGIAATRSCGRCLGLDPLVRIGQTIRHGPLVTTGGFQQTLDPGFQPLDGAVERIERRPFTARVGIKA